MANKFRLEIELGNAEMFTYDHVADALIKVAGNVRAGQDFGTIFDANGNKVGTYKVVSK